MTGPVRASLPAGPWRAGSAVMFSVVRPGIKEDVLYAAVRVPMRHVPAPR